MLFSDLSNEFSLQVVSRFRGLGRLLLVATLLACWLPATLGAAEHESRIWTDSTGKKQVRAKFYDLKDGIVRLERPNGDIARVPLTKLSKEDQQYIRSGAKTQAEVPGQAADAVAKAPTARGLAIGDRVEVEYFGKWLEGVVLDIDYEWEEAKVQIRSENRTTSADMDELRYPGTSRHPILIPPASPTSQLKTIRPNYDAMRRLVASGGKATKVAADPRPASVSTWKPKAVRLGGQTDFFEAPAGFGIVTHPAPLALVVHKNVHRETLPRVELVDMAASRVLTTGQAPLGTARVEFSPSGTRVATLQTDLHGSKGTGQIDFWKIEDKKVKHWISFVPYVMNTWPNLDPEWFAWLNDSQAFTVNSEGQLLLWDVESGKAIYELLLDRSTLPQLSPGRKYLVLPTTAGLQFLEAATGDGVATVGSGDYRMASLAFSPSGKQLAVVSNGFLDVLDVTTGETTRSFPSNAVNFRDGVHWLDEEFLMTSSGAIVHVPLRVTAWKYEMRSQLILPHEDKVWVLLSDRSRGSQILAPLEMPPAEAKQAVEGLKEEDLLVVRPGETIAIDVQILGDNFLAQDVEQALKEALEGAGMKVGDSEHLKLVARTKTGKTETVTYRSFGQFRGEGEQVSVTSRIYELELQLDGATVWKRESEHSAPHHVMMERGESIQGAIARIMKPTAGFFQGRLPSYVVRPEYLEPLGTSKLSL